MLGEKLKSLYITSYKFSGIIIDRFFTNQNISEYPSCFMIANIIKFLQDNELSQINSFHVKITESH